MSGMQMQQMMMLAQEHQSNIMSQQNNVGPGNYATLNGTLKSTTSKNTTINSYSTLKSTSTNNQSSSSHHHQSHGGSNHNGASETSTSGYSSISRKRLKSAQKKLRQQSLSSWEQSNSVELLLYPNPNNQLLVKSLFSARTF